MRSDDDFAREVDAHIELETERLVADGLTAAEARAGALRKFGNVTASRERFHESRRVMWLEDLGKDLVYALRSLRRSPGFAAVAILTLALGIGANTSIFGIVYQTLIKPLPFDHPEQLVAVSTRVPQLAARFPILPVSPGDFLEYRRSNSVFAALSALKGVDFNLTGSDAPERLHGARVSANFFAMLGVRPALGRDFTPDEEQDGRHEVVLISHALWQRRFAADPALVNRSISLDGRPHTVIGVMPADLLFPTGRQLDALITFGPRVDVWRPLALTKSEIEEDGNFDFAVIGRLKAGVTAPAAQQDIDGIARANLARLKQRAPDIGDDFDLFSVVTPLHEVFTGEVRRGLLLLEAAVGVLLLIACVNLANLLLARMSSREREFATRAALGAGRERLLRQMLAESLVMTSLGGVAGVALAAWAGRLLTLYGPRTAATRAWTLDVPVVAFAVAAALITGLVFALIPAIHTLRRIVVARPQAAARVISESHGGRMRRTLVVVQVALSSALLMVAGLLLHSFVNVLRVDTGFAVERVLAVDLSLPARQYPPPQTVNFYRDLVDRVASRSGVTAAGAISLLPIAHEGMISTIILESDTQVRLDRPSALRRSVTPALFTALDIPLLAGRVFTAQEPARVAILSESLAHQLWPGVALPAVVGRAVRRDPAEPITTVVGVVGDIRADALDREAPLVFYQPFSDDVRRGMTLIVRTAVDPQTLTPMIRGEVAQLDPNLPIAAIRTMREVVSTSVAPRRFQMTLVALMAVLALALAVVGIYGVASYSVARRTQEIGLRLALGAERGDVLRSVWLDGMKPVFIGVAIGLAVGQIGALSIRSVLFQIQPLDPLVLIGVTSVLVVTATLACYVPAGAAAALDPVAALRSE